eukprot:CAMPEP_0171325232 /NCGR_PEP_ID=MMETSP0816-20121228/116677_1 /TAXON_ID=420281 /ORGANISM="Proboscia inermis, Strain CCAP1064/1" /LENGTH=68 /DNA_ID=CAMNT_0011824351 /DNA_START=1498 /DNA_END=1701 /DNA_ORIENTATION=-
MELGISDVIGSNGEDEGNMVGAFKESVGATVVGSLLGNDVGKINDGDTVGNKDGTIKGGEELGRVVGY